MRLHCLLKAIPQQKKPSSTSRRHFKHYETHCHPLSALLRPWLGWKRSWDPGAEHQLSLGSLQADREQERPPKTAVQSQLCLKGQGHHNPAVAQRWRRAARPGAGTAGDCPCATGDSATPEAQPHRVGTQHCSSGDTTSTGKAALDSMFLHGSS